VGEGGEKRGSKEVRKKKKKEITGERKKGRAIRSNGGELEGKRKGIRERGSRGEKRIRENPCLSNCVTF